MRRLLLLAVLVTALAGCGAKEEPSAGSGSGGSGDSAAEERPTLNGCLELWANEGDAHVGSTAVREVAGHSTVYAKVVIRDNLCHVEYATKALTNFGSYVQKDTSYGPFALVKSTLSKSEAREVVRTANATGQSDGTLAPGPPPS
jgi:hypothetical protein